MYVVLLIKFTLKNCFCSDNHLTFIILAPKLKHSHSENQESHSPHAAVLVVEVTARGRRGHGPPGLIYCRLTRCLFCKIMRTGDDMYRLNQQTVGGQSVIFTTLLFIV